MTAHMKLEDKMCVRILCCSQRPKECLHLRVSDLFSKQGSDFRSACKTTALLEEGFLFRFKELLVAALA